MIPAGPGPGEPQEAAATEMKAAPRALGPKQYMWIVGAALVFAALLQWLGPILTPFLVGAVFAYLASPAVNWAERRRVPRTVGTLVAVIVIVLLVLALLLILAPLVQAEFGQLFRRLPDLGGRLYGYAAPWLKENLDIEMDFDLASIRQFISENMEGAQALATHVFTGLKAGGLAVLGIVINLALIPVVMFYLLRDWNTIVGRIDELLPRRWLGRFRKMAGEVDSVLAEFVRGQLSVMGVLAIYYVAGLSLAGLKFAVPIGLLTGLLVFIPYVGFGLGLTLGVLAALLQWSGWPGFAAVLVVYGIGQLLENYVLVPWLVGDRIGLHPLAVIFALLAFGQLFGFAGVLLALPVSAALLVGLRHLRAAYFGSDLYR
jgi:predicted PurR-regulated permease PerM